MSLHCQGLYDMAEAELIEEEKKLFRRERDDQKMPDWRERLSPKNMQGGGGSKILSDQDRFSRDAAVSMPEQDHQQHQAQEGQNMSLHCKGLYDMAEGELVEADQGLEVPEGEDGGQFKVEVDFLSPNHDHSSYHLEGVFPVRDSIIPLGPVNHKNQSIAGQDRVPIRLPLLNQAGR